MVDFMFLTFIAEHWLCFLVLFLFSYLFGSLNFAIIISRVISNDIRDLGSKNAGFTNVLRSIGILPAILTFLGDFLKSILVIYISKLALNHFEYQKEALPFYLYLIGFFCFIGHIYPCYFGFSGGKGILSAWAINLFINYRVFIIFLIIYLIVLAIFKIVSVASVATTICFPFVVFLVINSLFCAVIATLITIIAIVKHRSNLERLANGLENKISVNKKR